ncbi:MAG: type II secretion system protein [Phycisphaerales bacterium]
MHAMRKTMAKGFTLVEILIVVVILGILAAIVVPQFTNAADDARNGNVRTQTSTLENQIELYAAQNGGNYPTLAELQADWGVLVTGGFIKEMPKNPFSPAANNTDVTTMTAADSAAADAVAAAGDGTQGWFYDANTGFIRASGATY